MPRPAVIVASSLVVRGAVGGRGAVFALERLGFPVWSLPTVVLPWHPGHGRATITGVPGADFAALATDLAGARWLGEVGGVLAGYFGAAEQVGAIAELVAAARAANPALVFLCDPVIGDAGGLYVGRPVAEAIRDRLLPVGDIVTPNRYELAWLVGRPLADNAVLADAARALGPREVVVTSAFAAPGAIGTLLVTPDATLLATHAMIDGAPNGTGDLFAALYLAHRLDGKAPAAALERAVFAVFAVVKFAAGADEMPLAAAQDALIAEPSGVAVTAL